MSLNILFITRDDLVKRTPFGGNISPDKLVPHVKTAQDKHMLPILGTVLFQYLQQQIAAGTVSGVYETLLDDYIKDCLVHYTAVEALPFLSYTFANSGVVRNVGEASQAPSKTEIDFLLDKSLQSAQFYAQRLRDYLIAQSPTNIPQYYQATGDATEVYPNRGVQYYTGWNI
jgi:hypothetical protein